MKNIILFLIISLFQFTAHTQNVGIDNPTPLERLDVNGNIRLSGEIRPGGAAGQNGQVLMNNGAGGMQWANLLEFKNMVTFTDTIPNFIPWIIPTGVTKIWVEAWGGGGAGLFAGGGAGAYLSIMFTVTPGQSFNFRIGKGGTDNPGVGGGNILAKSGTDTYVASPSYYYIAGGGTGGYNNTSNPYEINTPGAGGKFSTTAPLSSPQGSFYTQSGQSGSPIKFDYANVTSNQYYLTRSYGMGGLAPNTSSQSGNGAVSLHSIIVSPSSTTLVQYSSANAGIFPGGGGGGGDAKGIFESRAGANGLVIVHY